MGVPTWWYLFRLGFTTFTSISSVLGNILNQNRTTFTSISLVLDNILEPIDDQAVLVSLHTIYLHSPTIPSTRIYEPKMPVIIGEGGLNWAHKIIRQYINFEIIQETTHQPQKRLCISVDTSLSLLPPLQSFHSPSLNCCLRGWSNPECLIYIAAKHRNRKKRKIEHEIMGIKWNHTSFLPGIGPWARAWRWVKMNIKKVCKEQSNRDDQQLMKERTKTQKK